MPSSLSRTTPCTPTPRSNTKSQVNGSRNLYDGDTITVERAPPAYEPLSEPPSPSDTIVVPDEPPRSPIRRYATVPERADPPSSAGKARPPGPFSHLQTAMAQAREQRKRDLEREYTNLEAALAKASQEELADSQDSVNEEATKQEEERRWREEEMIYHDKKRKHMDRMSRLEASEMARKKRCENRSREVEKLLKQFRDGHHRPDT